jgi:NADH-quinone oxidoreductase subunit D
MIRSQEMLINMGPQHPSTHGVLRLILRTDGEFVYDVEPCIGYLHRSLEKIAENLTYPQFIPITDRLDYLAAINCNFVYCHTVERLMGIEVPLRAQYIRVIACELNRIASHLIMFGTMGMDMGAFTPFLYAIREREKINDLLEELTGARLTYNYIRIGGVAHDLPDGWKEKCLEFINYFRPKIKEYNDLLSYNVIFMKRLGGVGVLTKEDAINYGVTGPNLRATGFKWDLRKNMPYSSYDKFDFEVPVGTGEGGKLGDAFDRYMLRIKEMMESTKIIEQALLSLPEGEIMAKVPRVLKVKEGEVYFGAENPRGETGFYIKSNGGTKPERVKIRGASFSNIHALKKVLQGVLIQDLVAIVGSFDIILPESDR